MGSVFKKTSTRALPAGAEITTRKGQRVARWKVNGKVRSAPITRGLDGSDRIVTTSATYFAKYRDAAGVVCTVPTGCRDEVAARQVLAELERKAERIRSGVLTSQEATAGRHHGTSLWGHVGAYLAYLEAKGACEEHRAERNRHLKRLATDCGFVRLADLDRSKLESWLSVQARKGMAARTRNSYLTSALAFCNWCAEPTVGRLTANPFRGIPKANEKADQRRQRRAMTETELRRLLTVARERPLLDALTVRRGPRKGERYAKVRAEVRDRLEMLGRERALIYKTLVLTGLRKGELSSLTIARLHLEGPTPFAELAAADEKNRTGSFIPLRDDLAGDLTDWLAAKLQRRQAEAIRDGGPIPSRLAPDSPVFEIPAKLCKILSRDLRFAGIAKRDDRGRTLDVHALRHTCGTLMSKGGVAPRTAQAALRHSKIDLTMNLYTDAKLLDVRGALDALPDLPLVEGSSGHHEDMRATGTDGGGNAPTDKHVGPAVAPTVAPTRCNRGQSGTSTDNLAGQGGFAELVRSLGASGTGDKTKEPLTTTASGPVGLGATGLEPVTPSLSSWCSSQLS
jgi:integrase